MSAWHKLLSLAIVLLVVGCDSPTRLATFVDITSDEWATPIEVRFTVEPADTMVIQSLLLHARYGKHAATDQLKMMLLVTAPDGVQWSEPYALQLTPPSKPQELATAIYRERIEWRQCGEYSVTLSPMHIYRGVSAVGVELVDYSR